jgi:hypothetical protein
MTPTPASPQSATQDTKLPLVVTLDLLDGDQARPLADRIRDLYADVFSEPPYNEGPQHVGHFVARFSDELGREGFALATASDDGELVGAAYGWTLPAGAWWPSATSHPPPELRIAPKFAVKEWMVRGSYRGNRIGQQLLDLLLAGRTEPYAVLASNPQAPARKIYDRLGWRFCGTSKPELLPPVDLLALRLPRESQT